MNRKLYLLKLSFLQTKPHIRFYIYIYICHIRSEKKFINKNKSFNNSFSINGSNNRQQKIRIENFYYLDFIDHQSIGLIEREEEEDSVEEEIMDFLIKPG